MRFFNRSEGTPATPAFTYSVNVLFLRFWLPVLGLGSVALCFGSTSEPTFEITPPEARSIENAQPVPLSAQSELSPGMSAKQIIAKMGQPDAITPFVDGTPSALHWTYRRKQAEHTMVDRRLITTFEVTELLVVNDVLITGRRHAEVVEQPAPTDKK